MIGIRTKPDDTTGWWTAIRRRRTRVEEGIRGTERSNNFHNTLKSPRASENTYSPFRQLKAGDCLDDRKNAGTKILKRVNPSTLNLLGMEPQFGLASRDDLWRLQNEMKNVYATQAEHADRLMRLERRQDDDARIKSVWGNQSPFPSLLNGTPQQGMHHYIANSQFCTLIPSDRSWI